jgi:hypothetical protein
MSTFEEMFKAPAAVRSLETEAAKEQRVERNEDPGNFAILPRDIIHDTDLSNGAVRLYCLLMSYAWMGTAIPSKRILALNCGVDLGEVSGYLDELIEADALTERYQGRGEPNLYYFHDDEIWKGPALSS